MNSMKSAVTIIVALLSTACATPPCSKTDLGGIGNMPRKWGPDNKPIIEGPDGNDMTFSITKERHGILFSMPNAAESPTPTLKLVRDNEAYPVKMFCGAWHNYNPFGHTWEAGITLPKNHDGFYHLCITYPVVGKSELITDCSTQVGLNLAIGKGMRKQLEERRRKK